MKVMAKQYKALRSLHSSNGKLLVSCKSLKNNEK